MLSREPADSQLWGLLHAGAEQMKLALSRTQIELLLRYLGMLDKWNHTFNLSAIREPDAMVKLHLLDSLSIAPYLQGQTFIDVGSGGGLPGIPLAICFPQRAFTLLDSAGKKARFMFQARQELKLDNVRVENTRVEQHRPEHGYDGVISRAFASVPDMLAACRHLLTPVGRFWAMKGQVPAAELSHIEKHYIVEHCHYLQVPGIDAQRCLLVIKPRVSSLSGPGADEQ